MTESTDRLITGLVDGLEPVSPLPRVRSAFAIVLAVWSTMLGLVLWSQESPAAAAGLMTNKVYLVSFLGLVVSAFGATVSALAAGHPGRVRSELVGLAICGLGLVCAAIACFLGMEVLATTAAEAAAHAGGEGMCFRRGMILSLLPAGVILSFLVRGWTSHPIRAALVAAAASGALGAAIVHLSCGSMSPRHWLMGHVSIPLVLALVSLYPLGALLRRLRS